MDIKLKRKRAINKRIMISFMIVLVLSFTITGILYSVVSKQFIMRQSRTELKRAVEAIETNFDKYLERDVPLRNVSVKMFTEIELISDVLGTSVIILKDGQIANPRSGWTLEKLNQLKQTAVVNEEQYVFYSHENSDENLPYDSIVLIKRYNEIENFRRIGILSMIISFGIGLVIAVLISLYISHNIYKPIKILKDSMKDYMSDKTPVTVYHSNDEIEELSDNFKLLTDKMINLDKRQKQFFQNSSHELKTPLMSIQGYVEAIKDGIVSEDEMDHSLDIIIGETQRLKNIVDDVIYLSKIDNMEDDFVLKSHSLDTIISDAVNVVNPLLIANKITMEVNCSDDIELVCDYDKIKRVFINLIGNASRYAKSKVVVNVNRHEKHLMIDVIDDGNGFEYGQEETIFDRFHKGEKGGSGIGLSLTKEIIEKHGGTIKAINQMNYGAIFKIEFQL
jgi:signal transduction histidine kinase